MCCCICCLVNSPHYSKFPAGPAHGQLSYCARDPPRGWNWHGAATMSGTPALAFDEFGRPFIIIRDQSSKRRLKGIEAHKVSENRQLCVCTRIAALSYICPPTYSQPRCVVVFRLHWLIAACLWSNSLLLSLSRLYSCTLPQPAVSHSRCESSRHNTENFSWT